MTPSRICTAALLVCLAATAQTRTLKDVPAGFTPNVADTWANRDAGTDGKWTEAESADTYGYDEITKGGKVTADCEHFAKEGHENLFDDTPAKWCAKQAKIWAQYEMPQGVQPAPIAYAITSANDFPDRDPKDWQLLGSNDGKEWTVLDARKGQSFFQRHFKRLYKIAEPAAFSFYRFEVLANHGNEITQIEEVELLVPGKPDPELTDADVKALKALADQADGYQPLFASDLSNAQTKEGAWDYRDGILVAMGGGDIWTKDRYGDFILDLDFRCAEDTNSGVFLRCANIGEWLHTAIEVQIQQPVHENNRHNCGGIFDVKGPDAKALRPVGEWNHYTIIAKANRILVWLNGVQVTDIDLNRWTTAGRNPDGSPNKFRYAYRAMAREGHLGLQYHGQPIAFRNVRLKVID